MTIMIEFISKHSRINEKMWKFEICCGEGSLSTETIGVMILVDLMEDNGYSCIEDCVMSWKSTFGSENKPDIVMIGMYSDSENRKYDYIELLDYASKNEWSYMEAWNSEEFEQAFQYLVQVVMFRQNFKQ